MVATAVLDRLRVEFDNAPHHLAAAVQLLEEGAPVPFIARHRKDATGGMDEGRIREIRDRLAILNEVEERKAAIRQAALETGRLTPDMERRLAECFDRLALDDLSLPFRPRRRTRAAAAAEKGLAPLAQALRHRILGGKSLAELAADYVDPARELPSPEAVLQGAAAILAEWMAEDAEARQRLRAELARGDLVAQVADPAPKGAERYKEFHAFRAPVRRVAASRMLAIRRGEREEILRVRLEVPQEKAMEILWERFGSGIEDRASELGSFMEGVMRDALKRLLLPACEAEVRRESKERADRESIRDFGEKLRAVLLAPPMPGVSVLGVAVAGRKGLRVAAVDTEGGHLESAVLHPEKAERREEAAAAVARMVLSHKLHAVALGNGPQWRDAAAFLREALLKAPEKPDPFPHLYLVDDAGVGAYSSSAAARTEFPTLEPPSIAAVSIARRLHDPLVEMAKVDPRLLGAGHYQFQHDVHQGLLARGLEEVVESCVNLVGAELHTVTREIAAHLSGFSRELAKGLVELRDREGPPGRREDLLKVPGMTEKHILWSGGFLRLRGTGNPLDATRIHPEHFPVVERIAQRAGVAVEALLGNEPVLDRLDLEECTTDPGGALGPATLLDILEELRRPGFDARGGRRRQPLREDKRHLKEIQKGMELEGRVTNVTEYGAFVDIGARQDGLVHISQMADRFVQATQEVVKVGDVVKVRVLEVDPARRRVSLSMRPPAPEGAEAAGTGGGDHRPPRGRREEETPAVAAFSRAARPPRTSRGRGGEARGAFAGGEGRGRDRDTRGGGRGPRGRDFPRRDGPPRVYTVEPESTAQEAPRGVKGELKSLAGLRTLFGLPPMGGEPKKEKAKETAPKPKEAHAASPESPPPQAREPEAAPAPEEAERKPTADEPEPSHSGEGEAEATG